MPLTNDQKTEILDRLRLECDFDELTEYDDQTPVSFLDRVKQDMAVIVEKGLNKDCPNWGESFRNLLHSKKFKYEEIAARMGVHHASVIDTLKKSTADPFYLEAFSLIFQVSPYTLLGLKVPYLISPIFFGANSKMVSINIIMNLYCKCDSIEELNRLNAIIKVGKLRPDAYKDFAEKYSKRLQGVFAKDLYKSPLSRDSSWTKSVVDHIFCFRSAAQNNNKEQYDFQRAFLEAYYVTQDLEKRFPRRLKELAQMALNDDLGWWIVNLMLTKNYPYTHTKLQEYAVEKLIEESNSHHASTSKEKLRGQKRGAQDVF